MPGNYAPVLTGKALDTARSDPLLRAAFACPTRALGAAHMGSIGAGIRHAVDGHAKGPGVCIPMWVRLSCASQSVPDNSEWNYTVLGQDCAQVRRCGLACRWTASVLQCVVGRRVRAVAGDSGGAFLLAKGGMRSGCSAVTPASGPVEAAAFHLADFRS